jgi:Ca2+-binding RTX toxin-like protein
MGMNTDAVQRLYVAYFNRPADPASLAVYEAMLPSDREATQAELEALAETYFSPSQEYADLYSGMSNSQIINQMYQNLFGRDAEPAGLLHWTGKLISGEETFASIALQLTYSAQGTDADSIAAKIDAANAFTTEVASDTDSIVGFSGNEAAASARSWLATVTDSATATAAIAGVATAVTNAVNATAAVGGQTYQLEAGQDVINASGGSDTFDGVANSSNGAVNTLTSIDQIDGGGGTDTVLLQQGDLSDLAWAPLTSVEAVVTNGEVTLGPNAQAAGINNVQTSDAGNSALTLATGYTNDAFTYTGQASNFSTIDFQNLAAGTNMRVTLDPSLVGNNTLTMASLQAEDSDGAVTGGISNVDDEGTLLRSSTDATMVFDVRGTDGTSYGNYSEVILGTTADDTVTAGAGENVFVVGGSGADTLTGDAGADHLDGGAGADSLVSAAGNDASVGGAGNDSITSTTGNDTLAGGDGNDVIDGGAGEDDLDGDAGNDSITVGAGSDNAAGGAGNDTIVMGAGFGSDTIAGGDGSDLITTDAVGTSGDALFANTTGVETLTFTTAGTNTLGTNADTAGIATVNLVGGAAETVAAATYTSALTVNLTGAQNVSVTTGAGNDTIAGDTTANGFDGSDTINGGAGNDTLSLQTDVATIDFDSVTNIESVVLAGDTTGADAIAVTVAAITTQTAADTVAIDASGLQSDASGTDTFTLSNTGTDAATAFNVTGSANADNITTGDNADTINADAIAVTVAAITTQTAADTVAADAGNDEINGEAGNDSITVGAGSDNADGGAGNDTIVMGANFGSDTIAGGDGSDLITSNALGTSGDALFANTTGVESLTLTSAGTNTIGANAQAAGIATVTLSGADTVNAGAYTTGLTINLTGAANVNLTSGSGDDTIAGDSTNDSVNGSDTINGGTGNDTLSLQTDQATLDFDSITNVESVVVLSDGQAASSSTDDTVSITVAAITTQTAADVITIDASGMLATANETDALAIVNSGTDAATAFNVTGSAGDDNLDLGDNADTVNAGAGADTVAADAGADVINGDGGDDSLSGEGGNDTINGGAGNDTITGGGGQDQMTGGAGSDTFVTAVGTTSLVYDTITDFSATNDTISGLGTGTDGSAETFNSAALSLGANATFQDYLDDACNDAAGGNTGDISWFQFNGNTYLVQDNDSTTDTFVDGTDIVVEISGLVDLSGMTVGDGELGP